MGNINLETELANAKVNLTKLRAQAPAGTGNAARPAYTLADIPNFADDTAAATGGVVVGGLYRTASALKIRVA